MEAIVYHDDPTALLHRVWLAEHANTLFGENVVTQF
jgi:hypothetical protein